MLTKTSSNVIKQLWGKGLWGKAIIIVGPFLVICLCCPALVVTASSLGRTTPTVDVSALQTHTVETIIAQARQTDAARPSPTLTGTWTFTPTLTLLPSLTFTLGPTSTITATIQPTRAATSTTAPLPTAADTLVPTAGNCNPAYPDFCITHDMTCTEIGRHNFTVLPPDPYGLDRDNDGIGCEKN